MQPSEENDERVMSLAAAALRMRAGERQEFLRAACADHPDLLAGVSDVVQWEERMGNFLQEPFIDLIDFEQLDPETQVFNSGQTVAGRFFIMGEVGQGGMGIVYEAFDRKRNQRIAIKCAKSGFGRLLSPELESALGVRHTNICLVNEIHTAQTEQGVVDFLTMEFLDGETLAARLQRGGKVSQIEASNIASQLCAGLAAAHAAGILHRDLKPGNIFLTKLQDGSTRAVITDFGLSTEARFEADLAGGTPRYMAPELWKGEKPSAASDVYALGVILYEMVTGKNPVSGSTMGSDHPPQPNAPTWLVPELSHRWDDALLAALDPDPRHRPSAVELQRALQKPVFYRSPALLVAMFLIASLVAAYWPQLRGLFRPADIRIAVLPPATDPESADAAKAIVQDVLERLDRAQEPGVTIAALPPSELISENAETPEKVKQAFHATHALQVKFSNSGGQILVEQSLFDLLHDTRVSHTIVGYPKDGTGAVPAALFGSVSNALHLRSGDFEENISPAATIAYDRGLAALHADPPAPDTAIAQFRNSVSIDPTSSLPLAGLAEALLFEFESSKTGSSLDEARQAISKAEALAPASVKVRMASGRMHETEGKYAQAQQDYQRVLELQPRSVDAHIALAHLYDLQDIPDQALAFYRKAIALDPDYYEPYEWLGAYYYQRGSYSEAEEQFRKEVEKAPGRLTSYGNLGGILLAQGKYQDAIDILRSGLRVRTTPQTLNNLGAALANLHRDKEAISAYSEAVRLDSQNYKYWVNLGDSYRRTGQLERSVNPYRRGLELARADLLANPDRGMSRAFAAYLEMRLGDRDVAYQDIAEALSSWPHDAQVMLCAVLLFEASGRRESALAVLQHAPTTLIEQIKRHPDLADFSQDPRFKKIEREKGES